MNKNFIKVVLNITVLLVLLIPFNFYEISYVFGEESKIDLLKENQEKQKELESRISELDNILKLKTRNLENNEQTNLYEYKSQEIVTISFIQRENINSEEEKIKTEIAIIEQSKNKLHQELQDIIIEGVQLEKCLEEEVIDKIKFNNIDFIKGMWPLSEYKDISSSYGYRIHPITQVKSFHKGIDIPAPMNTDVLASDDGIVIFSGYQNGYGNVVKLKHFDGKITIYAHNNSNVVSLGEIVKKGQVISKVGSTGNSTGNHVHFEVIVNGENINPINGVIR